MPKTKWSDRFWLELTAGDNIRSSIFQNLENINNVIELIIPYHRKLEVTSLAI